VKNLLFARFAAGITSKLTNRKLTRILILILVTILLPITSVPDKAEAARYYPYLGSSYSRYSLGSFTVKITITFGKKSSGCSGWAPTNLVATPGPVGTKAVFLSWDHPRCGKPSDGYQIRLIERGGYDAGTASQENGSFSYSSGSTKYLNVGSNENKVMIEGFGSSKVVELQVFSLGQSGQTNSPVVISNTAPVTSSAVSPTTVTVEEVTSNFSSYKGTSGLRVNWAPSLGDVNYYVLQFTDNLNQDLAHTELTAKKTTNEMYIENYVNGRYKVRIKTVGVNGSIAFSDYVFVWTRYAPTASTGSTGQTKPAGTASPAPSNPTNKSEPVPVLPALTPIVKQISSNPTAKTVTLFVTNFQPGFTWVFNTYGTIKAEIDSKGYITLSGVNSCGYSGVFMAVNRTGYLTGTANPEYEMACVKLAAPTFSNIKSNTTGFTVQITNYDPSLKYFMSRFGNSNATLSMDASGLITATGVSSSSYDTTILISVTKEGFYSNQSQVSGFAVDVAYEPILGEIYRTAEGIGFKIINFDPQLTWYTVITGELPGRANLDYSSGIVTVTPIRSGETLQLELAASKSGKMVLRRYIPLTGLTITVQPALTPTFSAATSQATGFTSQVSNYNSAYTWSVSTSAGSASINSTGLISVSGLSAGQSATVTARTSRTGYSSGASTVSGQATSTAVSTVQPALTPTFSAATSQATGFTAQVSNYNSAYTWSVSTSAGSASINSTGLITVSGLAAGQSATVTTRTDRTGYSSGSAITNGQATAAVVVTLQPALTPTFSAATSQATGFTSQVSNYNSAYTWSVSTSAGSASINSTGLITVSGLAAGQSATVTARTDRTGYSSGSAITNGQATAAPNQPALVPGFNTPTKAAGGFFASITNYSSSYQWSASTSAGSVAINSSGQVTVTGLTQGQAATVTVRNTRTGYDSGSSTFSSAAIVTSLTPTFGALSSAINGFWIVITNYDPTFIWKITSSSGSAFVYENGNLGVQNIGRNTSVRVTVTATKNGISSTASTVGSSN